MNASSFSCSLYFPSLFLFYITLILPSPFASSTTTFIDQSESDEVALLAFKSKIVQDPHGVLNSWNESHHFCQWEGITCGRKYRRVTVLDLNTRGLYGSLSPYIGNLSFLRKLMLFNNSIQGEIPHEFGRLFRVNYLFLCNNSLSGEIPANLSHCSRLQALGMENNQLSGILPPGISNLVNLNYLGLSGNQFTGPIPIEFGKLKKLQIMYLHNNQLLREIPASLGNLFRLEKVRLQNNKLSGVIPSSIENLKQLMLLDLSNNHLSGSVPKQIFNLPHLSILLKLSQNHLVGTLSPKVGNLKLLTEFDVSNNNLSGRIPKDIGSCSSLEYLYLGGNFLNETIPPSLSSLRAIRELDLSSNNLSGQIPEFLEKLPLEKLNLSFNTFEGKVPIKGIFTNASAISVVGNSNRLCGGISKLQLPKCPGNNLKKDKISLVFKILISTASAVLGFIIILSFIFFWSKKTREKQASGSTLDKSLMKVSYQMLLKATEGFSPTNLVGVGGFSSVYKGILDQDGVVVAVKVLNLEHQRASKSFMMECKVLKNIRHRNLVRVITSCSSIDFEGNDFKAIVYEFMENGNLENWLHPSLDSKEEHNKIQSLTILQRISIAIDVASAVEYLHIHCQEPVLHCDLKSSNVLLDSNMTGHIGDFGLARFFPKVSDTDKSSSIGIKGTIGYAPPEYGLGNEVSTNGDIYSFGILLLEMVTGKKPTNRMFEGDLNLHSFTRMALPDRVMNIVDPILINEKIITTNHKMRQAFDANREECLISMVRIGVACSMESPQDRMNISNVIHELQSVRKILLQSTTRFNMQRRQ